MIIQSITLEELKNLPTGSLVTAATISRLSGLNQVKGIHPIDIKGSIKAVIILCTIGGKEYPNEWLDEEHQVLKYFLEGRMDKKVGYKKYNLEIKSNKSIIESTKQEYPLYVFSRDKKGLPFVFEGEFYFNKVMTDDNGIDKYVELMREETAHNFLEIDPVLLEKDMSIGLEETKEGRRILRKHYTRERDRKIVEAAKQRYKQKYGVLDCEVCGFNFETQYGERGKDFIEGHHNIPISELDEMGGQTRVEDIALMCSNCHRMIHRYKPWLTVEELRGLIMKRIVVVGAVIFNEKDEILCALRSPAMTLPNKWEFPGGKVEPGESMEKALQREISEEMNCEIKVMNKITEVEHAYNQVIVNLHTYEARIISGQPELQEHAELRWVLIEKLNLLEWAPADIPTVEEIQNRRSMNLKG